LPPEKLALSGPADAQPGKSKPANLSKVKSGTTPSFSSLKQIDAGRFEHRIRRGKALRTATAVILLHGWPYDIHSSFVEVTRCWRRRVTG